MLAGRMTNSNQPVMSMLHFLSNHSLAHRRLQYHLTYAERRQATLQVCREGESRRVPVEGLIGNCYAKRHPNTRPPGGEYAQQNCPFPWYSYSAHYRQLVGPVGQVLLTMWLSLDACSGLLYQECALYPCSCSCDYPCLARATVVTSDDYCSQFDGIKCRISDQTRCHLAVCR